LSLSGISFKPENRICSWISGRKGDLEEERGGHAKWRYCDIKHVDLISVSELGLMEAVAKFTLDVSSQEAAELRAAVKTKLSELIGNDTDDVLVEYVVVLVSHGKQQSQAIVDLEAFLGDESTAFVTWLWDHLTTNKHLYMCTKEDNHLSMDAGDEDVQLVMEIEPETKQLVTFLASYSSDL
jgi:Ni,Fe-hydrogenase III component G